MLLYLHATKWSILQMKNLLITLLLLVPFVTGCANIDTRVNINKDKSANVVTSITYKGNLSDLTDDIATKIDSVYESFLDNAYKVEKAYGAQLSTITATKSVNNVEQDNLDLSSLGLETKLPDGKFIDVKKNFFITSYNIHAVFDYNAQSKKIETMFANKDQAPQKLVETMNPEYFQKYAEDIQTETQDEETQIPEAKEVQKPQPDEKLVSTFGVQLPSFASYNNADSVDGFTYIWNIKDNKVTEIKLQYVKYNGVAISLIIIIGILLLVLLSKRILKHDAQKRMDNVDNIV
jgi:hypothetical protein